MKITSFNRTRSVLLLLIFLAVPFLMTAQGEKIKLTGKVVDETNKPLPGATVLLKSTNISTTSDFDGSFSFTVSDANQIFVVSYMGYKSSEVNTQGKIQMVIKLLPESTTLNNVVVIGYGQLKSKDITGSISGGKMKDLSKQPVANIGEAIQGRAAGVQVISSGQPGNNPTFRIRGTGTIGNNDPLIVVDGMPECFR